MERSLSEGHAKLSTSRIPYIASIYRVFFWIDAKLRWTDRTTLRTFSLNLDKNSVDASAPRKRAAIGINWMLEARPKTLGDRIVNGGGCVGGLQAPQ